MIELSKDRYSVLLEYVMRIPFNMLMARSVIAGHVGGRVFADSFDEPKSFYIVHPYGMTYLCGKSDTDSFNKGLTAYFEGNSFERQREEWLQAYPRDWDIFMDKLVGKNIAVRYNRINFKFDKERFYEGYLRVDKARFKIISTPADMLFEIKGSVVPKYYWDSPQQFVERAKAFSVIIDGEPVSTAFTSAIHDNQLEIGIETKKEYYGRGLAYLVCAKLIEYCLENGLEPVWSCRLENTASYSLSNKLGFYETLRMPYYHIPFA